jgi:ATP-dependent Clp protease ATP-binding subunit ClpC
VPENVTPSRGEAGPHGDHDGERERAAFDEFLARYLAGERATQSRQAIDISRLLARRTQTALARAGSYAVARGQGEVDALHLLRVLVTRDPAAGVVRGLGITPERVVEAVEARLPQAVPGAAVTEAPAITPSLQRVLFHAFQIARASGATYIDLEHLFLALVLDQDTPAGQVLTRLGITPQAVTRGVRPADVAHASDAAETAAADASDGAVDEDDDAQDATASTEAGATPMLDRFGEDLTARAEAGELDPVIGRDDEIVQTVEILSRRTKNNPVLVGEAGVGKTAVVEGLAERIASGDVPPAVAGRRVITLDLPALVAGTRFRGDFEERLTRLLDEIAAHRDELVVFIDELHTVVGAGGSAPGDGMDAANILKPRLARGDLHLVGATTLDEYRRIEHDPALARRFQPVTVDEPSEDDAVRIVEGVAPAFAHHHDVRYTPEALRAAVRLSARYLPDRRLPDKAIDLIDQAGARLRLRLGAVTGERTVDTAPLMERLAELEAEKNAAVDQERYEDAGTARDRIREVQHELDEATAHNARVASERAAGSQDAPVEAVVDEAQIAGVVARRTGIPAERISEGERARLAHLEEELHARVVGQDDAVSAVARAVRRGRTGLADPHRPVGSFLFLGPTGVGKTELARTLARSLFGDERAMVRFDMSEFGERHTASRLVGAPPGYVGFDQAGQLTEAVRRRPYSVLLLDEIEKAHPDVFDLLLQVLDDGRLTDGQGRTVDFRNTVIIMTSNLGSEFLASRSGALGFVANDDPTGFGSEQALRDRVMGRLRETMRPEFLNRIDEIVLFHRLTRDQVARITRGMVDEVAARLAGQGVRLVVSDAAVARLAELGWQPEYGARPLRRTIQRELDDRLADRLVTGTLQPGDTARVDEHDRQLSVTVESGTDAHPAPHPVGDAA